MYFSIQQVLALEPCWGEEKTRQVVGRGIGMGKILSAGHVAVSDRLWLVTQLVSRQWYGPELLSRWAIDCAHGVMEGRFGNHDSIRLALSMATALIEGSCDVKDAIDAQRYVGFEYVPPLWRRNPRDFKYSLNSANAALGVAVMWKSQTYHPASIAYRAVDASENAISACLPPAQENARRKANLELLVSMFNEKRK